MGSLGNHVTVTVSRNANGVKSAGFGVPLLLTCNAPAGGWIGSERTREYADLDEGAVDWPNTGSAEYRALQAYFSQAKSPEKVKVGRCSLASTIVYALSIVTAALARAYAITVTGDGVTETEVSYTAPADLTFTAEADDETLTTAAHGMSTGDGPYYVSNSGGALPSGLSANTPYWIIKITADTYQLAATKADALAETEVTFTTDGTGTQTLERNSNDVIAEQLKQALNAVTGANYTAALAGATGSKTLTVTANAAGEWFALEIMDLDSLTSVMTHADPGVATDLAAIKLYDAEWYAIDTSPLGNSDGVVKAAAAYAEANDLIYVFDLPETFSATQAAGYGDTLDDLKGLAYDRTMGAWHPRPNEFMASAWMGRVLPINAGAENWKFKKLIGVTASNLTSAQRAKIIARNGNVYETGRGANWTAEGTAASGEFLDTIRGLDWLIDDVQTSQMQVFLDNDKIEMDEPGVAKLEAALRASGARAQAPERKVLALDPAPVYTIPRVSSVSDADRARRNFPGMKLSGRLAGAVNTTDITINVVP